MHKSIFHRYTTTTNSSTDEGPSSERGDVTTDKYPFPIESTSSINNWCTYVNTNIIEECPTEGGAVLPSISTTANFSNIVGEFSENDVLDV